MYLLLASPSMVIGCPGKRRGARIAILSDDGMLPQKKPKSNRNRTTKDASISRKVTTAATMTVRSKKSKSLMALRFFHLHPVVRANRTGNVNLALQFWSMFKINVPAISTPKQSCADVKDFTNMVSKPSDPLEGGHSTKWPECTNISQVTLE